jgi:hypothetical protein
MASYTQPVDYEYHANTGKYVSVQPATSTMIREITDAKGVAVATMTISPAVMAVTTMKVML